MKINKLKFENLRNHLFTEIELNPSINIFNGLNGSGKTTILEAIAISSFSKSFLPTSDSNLINKEQEYYFIESKCCSDLHIPFNVSVSYKLNEKKRIKINGNENQTPKDLIGNIPLVILSPDFKNITYGTPEDRRTFVDRILSQISKLYLEELYRLKKSLKQRNHLLSMSKKHNISYSDEIEEWSKIVSECSAEIILKRKEFTKQFKLNFQSHYKQISANNELVDIVYQPHSITNINALSTKNEIYTALEEYRKSISIAESKRGLTLYGAHKDDFDILINDGKSKEFASQGQHKSLLIALKFAEFDFIKEFKDETPIILLDDIFSELDEKRSSYVLDMILHNEAQNFITGTEAEKFNTIREKSTNCSFFMLEKGNVQK